MANSSPELTRGARERLELLFPPGEWEEVAILLRDECGNNLPFLGKSDVTALDRFRFAVLKLSEGDRAKLDKALALAKQDWRDLLMAAGFANDPESHRAWMPDPKY